MRTIALVTYGGPEVLHSVELPDPHADTGQVRIRVQAAAVAPVDAMLRTGLLAGAYAGYAPPYVPGMEVAGVIDEVGSGLEDRGDIKLGAFVVGFVDTIGSHGGYSDYVVLPAASVTHAPRGSTAPEAASFLNNALTARNALDTLALKPGSSLLVTGAAGSVGGYVVELAAYQGISVVGVASAADAELVRSMGAARVIPRGSDLARRVRDEQPDGVDAVADAAILGTTVVGGVRDGGQIAALRSTASYDLERGVVVHHLNVRERATDQTAISSLRDLVEQSVLSMRVGPTFAALDAPRAHSLLDAGGTRGRIILEFPVQ